MRKNHDVEKASFKQNGNLLKTKILQGIRLFFRNHITVNVANAEKKGMAAFFFYGRS